MPIMTVTTLAGKSLADKQKLAAELTDCVQELMQRPRSIIRVIYQEIPYGSYAIAGEFLQETGESGSDRDDTILRIAIMTGRSAEQKRTLIEKLLAVLENNAAFSAGAVRIIIEENPAENFYRSR